MAKVHVTEVSTSAANSNLVIQNGGSGTSSTTTLSNSSGTTVSDTAAALQLTASVGAVTLNAGVAHAEAAKIYSSNASGGVNVEARDAGLTLKTSTGAANASGPVAISTGAAISGGAGGLISLASGAGEGAGAGGAVTTTSGQGGATGAGGVLTLKAGAGGGTSGAGGAANLTGGAATNGDSAGGTVTITGGTGKGTASAGGVSLVGGTHATAAKRGACSMTSNADTAACVYLHADGGTSETIELHADQGTAVGDSASVVLRSDAGGVTMRSTANLKQAIYLVADGGTSETIEIRADQGTAVGENASINVRSDTGGVVVRSSANVAKGIYMWVDGGTSETMELYSEKGTVVGDSASINIFSKLGGATLRSTANLAKSVYLHANGGTTETIELHSDQGTAVGDSASVNVHSDAGGVTMRSTANLAKSVYLHANGGTSETVVVNAQQGTGLKSVEMSSTAGGVYIGAAASSNAKAVEIDVTAGGCTVTGNLTVTGTLTGGGGGMASTDNITVNNTGQTSTHDVGFVSKLLFDGSNSDITQLPKGALRVSSGVVSSTTVNFDSLAGTIDNNDYLVVIESTNVPTNGIRVRKITDANGSSSPITLETAVDIDNDGYCLVYSEPPWHHNPFWDSPYGIAKITGNTSNTTLVCNNSWLPAIDNYYDAWSLAYVMNVDNPNVPLLGASWGKVTAYNGSTKTFTVSWVSSAEPNDADNTLANHYVTLFKHAQYSGIMNDVSRRKLGVMSTSSDPGDPVLTVPVVLSSIETGSVKIGSDTSVASAALGEGIYFGKPGEGQWRITIESGNNMVIQRNISTNADAEINPQWSSLQVIS